MFKNHFPKIFILLMCAVLCIASAKAQETAKKPAQKKTAESKAETPATAKSAAPEPFIGTPDKIKWVQFAPGIEYGPVHGNCDKPGAPCVFQLRFAAGGKIPAHWHPVDENVTVISGTFMAGMGDSYDEAKMMSLPGGNVRVYAQAHASLRGDQGGRTGAGSRRGPLQNKLCESGRRSEQGCQSFRLIFWCAKKIAAGAGNLAALTMLC